ncbi:DUF4055 domain-containing protein [Methylocystis sp.]|uniref:DUF4055 domain-containing protein n=1 Tax=Methylocystis sp. TaxID=1911079 RepID=UPI003DA5ECC9
MMQRTPATVATPSAEVEAMQDDLQLIADVRAGLKAMRAKAGAYLPRYAAEDDAEWRRRVACAPWRPEFNDILLTLASKPFSRAVGFADGAPEPILRFADDVDARGNCLHVFARKLFLDALANGVSLILVDYPPIAARTLADEKRLGLRPYWALYAAEHIIACRTERIGGRDRIVHLRLRECVSEPDGRWGENEIEQVRVLEPGIWQTWRRKPLKNGVSDDWELFEEGSVEPADDGVRAVPLFLGERLGIIRARPPLLDLGHMQVELFRALSRQEEILTYAGSPMLSASGVERPQDASELLIGPRMCLYAPPGPDGRNGSYSYIQPDARNLKEIREHVGSIIEDMQRLGMAPTIERDGDASATEIAIASAKAHSALQAWALNLKDALEQAFTFTVPWMNQDDRRAIGAWPIAVDVHTDFSADVQAAAEANVILSAEKERVISKQTARDELARRGMLGPNFDPAEEDRRLAAAERN